MIDVMPPLEVLLRITQLGGWGNVEVFTLGSSPPTLQWLTIPSKRGFFLYTHPDVASMPSLWLVYGVREKQP